MHSDRDVRWMSISIKLIEKLWPDEFSDHIAYKSEYTSYHKTKARWFPANKKKIKFSEGLTFKEMLASKNTGGVRMDSKELWEKFDDYFAKNKLMYKKAFAFLASESGV